MRLARLLYSMVAIVMLTTGPAVGQMPTTVKNSTLREGNPKGARERLIIPLIVFSGLLMFLVPSMEYFKIIAIVPVAIILLSFPSGEKCIYS